MSPYASTTKWSVSDHPIPQHTIKKLIFFITVQYFSKWSSAYRRMICWPNQHSSDGYSSFILPVNKINFWQKTATMTALICKPFYKALKKYCTRIFWFISQNCCPQHILPFDLFAKGKEKYDEDLKWKINAFNVYFIYRREELIQITAE